MLFIKRKNSFLTILFLKKRNFIITACSKKQEAWGAEDSQDPKSLGCLPHLYQPLSCQTRYLQVILNLHVDRGQVQIRPTQACGLLQGARLEWVLQVPGGACALSS